MEDRRLSGGEGLSTPGPSQCACPLPIARRGRCRALCVCRPVDVPAQRLWRAVLVGSGVHSDRPVVSANPACHQSRESPDLNLLIPIQTCCRPPLPPPWARSGWRLPLGLQSLVVCVHRLHVRNLLLFAHINEREPYTSASCGMRTHDLPLTKRVLCQLS